MHPPPGNLLFFADKIYDDEGVAGVSLHPDRVFTNAHLEAYSPGCTTHLPKALQNKIIQAHHNVAHLFTPKTLHPALVWPFQFISPTAPAPKYIIDLRQSIYSSPNKSRYNQFSVNIFA